MILVLFVSCLNISLLLLTLICFCVFAEFSLYAGLFKCFCLSVLFCLFCFFFCLELALPFSYMVFREATGGCLSFC